MNPLTLHMPLSPKFKSLSLYDKPLSYMTIVNLAQPVVQGHIELYKGNPYTLYMVIRQTRGPGAFTLCLVIC